MAEVLVVGAGPTGLALSFELIRRGISVRLIDEKEGPSQHSKALGLQSRTLEFFEKMGILPDFLEAGLKAEGVLYHWKQKKLSLSLHELKVSYPFILILPQSKTEKILLKHFEKLGGQVEWNTQLLDIVDGHALLQTPNSEKEVDGAKWIIGCDGAHSIVRHSLKLPFKGAKFSESFLVADVEGNSRSRFDRPNIFLNKQGLGVVIPISAKGLSRLIFPLREKIEEEKVNADFLMSLLRNRGFSEPFEIKSIQWVSVFQIHRRMCAKLRDNHVFLAGDAAHIHSPVGGQGMNTSVQDAFNLAWKLELVIKGASFDSLLDTYEQERLPIAKQVLKGTTRATKLITFSQKWCPALFYWWIRLVLLSKKFRNKLLMGLSELSVKYPQNSIIHEAKKDEEWKGPKAGERAPNSHLANGKQLFDILKSRRHTVLLFDNHSEIEAGLIREYGDWIDVQVVQGQEVRNKYAAEPDSLYIIRPDGYIGYRSHSLKVDEVVSYLLRVFKPSSQRSKL